MHYRGSNIWSGPPVTVKIFDSLDVIADGKLLQMEKKVKAVELGNTETL